MQVLVTGAAGFIGSQITHALLQNGDTLTLLDNFSYGSYDNLIFDDHDFSDELIRLDVRDREGLRKLMTETHFDVIYHIAGIAPLPDCQSNPQEAVEVNVLGTINILENARKTGVPKIIFASTNAMYENETIFPCTETMHTLPTLIYPNTKYTAERFCASFCQTYGMNVTCLRFANVYGPHIDCLRKQPPFISYMIRELHYGRTPTFHSNGLQRRDYIYIDDLVELAILVQKSTGFEPVNVSSKINYSVRELYEMACSLMGKHIEANYVEPINYWKKYPELYEGAFAIAPHILDNEVNKCTLCDSYYAQQTYSWKPKIDIKEGLRRTIEYTIEMLIARDNALMRIY